MEFVKDDISFEDFSAKEMAYLCRKYDNCNDECPMHTGERCAVTGYPALWDVGGDNNES